MIKRYGILDHLNAFAAWMLTDASYPVVWKEVEMESLGVVDDEELQGEHFSDPSSLVEKLISRAQQTWDLRCPLSSQLFRSSFLTIVRKVHPL